MALFDFRSPFFTRTSAVRRSWAGAWPVDQVQDCWETWKALVLEGIAGTRICGQTYRRRCRGWGASHSRRVTECRIDAIRTPSLETSLPCPSRKLPDGVHRNYSQARMSHLRDFSPPFLRLCDLGGWLLRVVVTIALFIPALGSHAAEKRVALVIGNSAYASSPLQNPVNDAADMAIALRRQGFEVIVRTNLQTRQIGRTLSEFRSKLSPGAVALVFYAGHGLQIKGENYLPAVDADIGSEEDVPNQSMSVRQIMDVLEESKSRLNLVFLDACRNNPFARSFRSAERGLARVSTPSGTLISYATRPGSVAADGEGRNGLYTSKLLRQLDTNIQIEQALKRVVSEVKAASQGRQEPWMEGSIDGDFCFAGCSGLVAALSPSPRVRTALEIEEDLWNSVRTSSQPAVVEEYLSQYPQGRYVAQARVLLASLPSGTNKRPTQQPIQQLAASELESWTTAREIGTADAYRVYLSEFPQGRYARFAAAAIAKLQDAPRAKAPTRVGSIVVTLSDVMRGEVPAALSGHTWLKFSLGGSLESEVVEMLRAQLPGMQVLTGPVREDSLVLRLSLSDMVGSFAHPSTGMKTRLVVSLRPPDGHPLERSYEIATHFSSDLMLFLRSEGAVTTEFADRMPPLLRKQVLSRLEEFFQSADMLRLARGG